MKTPPPDSLIDCDIHNTITSAAIARYLPGVWQDYHLRFGRRQLPGDFYPKAMPFA